MAGGYKPEKTGWKFLKYSTIFAVADLALKLAPVAVPHLWAMPIGGVVVAVLNWWKHRRDR